jgi:hypothetical protein
MVLAVAVVLEELLEELVLSWVMVVQVVLMAQAAVVLVIAEELR